MKNKKNVKIGHDTTVKLRKFFYRNRLSGFKRILSFMIIGGLIASCGYVMKFTYQQYAASRAHVALLYPEIAKSEYPDGSRFTYYDLTSDEKIEKTLEIMRADGMYENYTVADIKKNIYVYNYLESAAIDAVSSARSEGNDYSYVANEYKITFIQPHDYKNKKFLNKIFTPDHSGEFLRTLMEVNREEIEGQYGGIKGFNLLTDVGDVSNYDYKEFVGIYRTKINSIVNHLNNMEKESPGFVSEKYNKSLKDVVGDYKLLLINKLDSITSFIDTSAISKDADIASNKLKVNIENNTLKFNKFADKVEINKYAQDAYDHTFTENLIVVTIHDTNGLYQARPKTAFDHVVNDKHMAIESFEEYETKINVLKQEYANYTNAKSANDEYERLCVKCDKLLSDFEADYEAVTNVARLVVDEYQNLINKNYIKAEITKKHILSTSLLMSLGIIFVMGSIVTLIVYAIFSVISDKKKMVEKQKKLEQVKAKGGSEQA